MARPFLILLGLLAFLAAPAHAQLFGRGGPPPYTGPPKGTPPAEAEVWPFPPPDPKAWWDDKWPKPAEAADPLGGRKLSRGERLIAVDNGVDAPTYRLWALPPLQWQPLRGDETIVEVWVRPSLTVRQTAVRVVVRRDGKAFVQVRAGLACCEATIGRRVGFDAELPPGSAGTFRALRADPAWDAPRQVRVDEGGGAAETVCLDGVAYDLTLMIPGRARSIRRACDSAEIGQAADILEPVLRAALGHEPRIDAVFPKGIDFSGARQAYRGLIASGGRLKPDPQGRAQAPGFEPMPMAEPGSAPDNASNPTP